MRKRILFYLFFVWHAATFAEEVSTSIVPQVLIKAPKQIYQPMQHFGAKLFISHQQLALSGSYTLAESLQNLSGLQRQDTTGNGSLVAFSMRGFGSNASSNTLFLINGIPITNPDLAGPDLNIFPVNEIEYVEILAGSESVLYGDQAVGGVINIVTRKPEKKLNVACNGGSYLTRNCYGAFADHYDFLYYHFFAGNKHSNNYRNHNDYDQNLNTGGLTYLYDKGQWSFDYNVGNEDMQYPGALTAKEVRQNRRQANNDTDYFTNWSGVYHLQNQHFFHNNLQFTTDFFRREMHGHGVLTSKFTQSRLIYFIRPQLQGTLLRTTFRLGVDAQTDGYHLGSLFGIENVHQQKYGGYGFFEIPLYSQLILSVGARAAQLNNTLESFTTNNNINRALVTTVGIHYFPKAALQFYLRRAGSFRFPKADENAFTPTGIDALRTQRGISYETGVKIKKTFSSMQLGIYQLNLRDEIAFDPTQTAQDPFGSNRNLSPTSRFGLIFSGKTPLTQNITLGGQYNFVNARFRNGINSGKRIPLVSENILNANLTYHLKENWYLFLESIYTGNQYSANDDANIAGKIGGYTVCNLNLRYQFKKLSTAFRLNNVLNKNYYFYTVYQNGTVFFYPAPGINFLFTIHYDFF